MECTIPWLPMKEDASATFYKYIASILLISLYFLLYPSKRRFFGRQSLPVTSEAAISRNIPFFYVSSWTMDDANPPIQDLFRSFHKYKDHCATAISSLTAAHEIAKKTEWIVFSQKKEQHDDSSRPWLSNIMERRITMIAERLELDGFVLEQLLKPIQFTIGITEREHQSYLITKDNSKTDVSSYDSAMHVITHVTRDWTHLGRTIRKSLYNWCIEKISTYRNKGDRILIPGAGLGRLTYDVFRYGYHVEGNEISIVMATAAFHILHGKVSGILHPFGMDYLINEVMSTDRYQSVKFPDIETHLTNDSLSLSYTIGDFVEIYSGPSYKSQYDSIVTCFFIDTASNIYEYIITIRNALKNGGVWINVGPLQWHMNAKLHPSGDELKYLIETMGFDIIEWSVDDEAINYRYDDKEERTRHTKYEGYKPIRFVAIYNSVDPMYQTEYDAQQMILNIRRSISKSPNMWNKEESPSYGHDTISHVTITELS